MTRRVAARNGHPVCTSQVWTLLGHGGEMRRPDGHAVLGEGEALGAVVQESDGQRQVAIQNTLPETESMSEAR